MKPNFSRLENFVAIVDAGSLTLAATRLGVSKGMVSRGLRQLEDELGSDLVVRSTRKLSLTDVGADFHADCLRILADMEASYIRAQTGRKTLVGQLRITSTAEYGARRIAPVLAAFARLHPALHIQYLASLTLSDLITERLDVAIRLGHLADSRFVAAKLGTFQLVAVGAPSYLREVPTARNPADLARMNWITLTGFDGTFIWSAVGDPSATIAVPLNGSIQSDSAEMSLQLILAGSGVGILPDWMISEFIDTRRLIPVLPGYQLPAQPIHAVFPKSKHMPAKVRAFIDFAKESSGLAV